MTCNKRGQYQWGGEALANVTTVGSNEVMGVRIHKMIEDIKEYSNTYEGQELIRVGKPGKLFLSIRYKWGLTVDGIELGDQIWPLEIWAVYYATLLCFGHKGDNNYVWFTDLFTRKRIEPKDDYTAMELQDVYGFLVLRTTMDDYIN